MSPLETVDCPTHTDDSKTSSTLSTNPGRGNVDNILSSSSPADSIGTDPLPDSDHEDFQSDCQSDSSTVSYDDYYCFDDPEAVTVVDNPARASSIAVTIKQVFDKHCSNSDIVLWERKSFVTALHRHVLDSTSSQTDHYTYRHVAFEKEYQSEQPWVANIQKIASLLSLPSEELLTLDPPELLLEQKLCDICEDTSSVLAHALPCGHTVCIGCWKMHAKVFYDQFSPDCNPYKIKCPCTNCATIMDDYMFDQLVVNDQYLWSRFVHGFWSAFFTALPRNDFIKKCINECCHRVAICKSNDAAITKNAIVACDCGFQWCYSCHSPSIGSHFPLSCVQVQTMIAFGKSMICAAETRFDDEVSALYASFVTLESRARINSPYYSSFVRAMLYPPDDGVCVAPDLLATDKLCHACGQNFLFQPQLTEDPNSSIVYCGGHPSHDNGGCGNAFCWICEQHVPYSIDPVTGLRPIHTCAWKSFITAEVRQNSPYTLNLEKYRVCTTCGAVIERRDGCNRITCICGQWFCWNCTGQHSIGLIGCKKTPNPNMIRHIMTRLSHKTIPMARYDKCPIFDVIRYIFTNSCARQYFDKARRSFVCFVIVYANNLVHWIRPYSAMLKLKDGKDDGPSLVTFLVQQRLPTIERTLAAIMKGVTQRIANGDKDVNFTPGDLAQHVNTLNIYLVALCSILYETECQ